MKKINPKKVLLIILLIVSVFIIVIGFTVGSELSSSLIDESSNLDSINIDGSDFTGLSQFMVILGSAFLPIIIIVCSLSAVLIIWIIYLSVSLVIALIKKIRDKKDVKGAEKTKRITLRVIILIILMVLAWSCACGLFSLFTIG